MARNRSPIDGLVDRLAGLARSFRLAVFGRQRPGRVVKDAIMTSAAEIDPAEADPRAVLPTNPPQEVSDPSRDEFRAPHE